MSDTTTQWKCDYPECDKPTNSVYSDGIPNTNATVNPHPRCKDHKTTGNTILVYFDKSEENFDDDDVCLLCGYKTCGGIC